MSHILKKNASSVMFEKKKKISRVKRCVGKTLSEGNAKATSASETKAETRKADFAKMESERNSRERERPTRKETVLSSSTTSPFSLRSVSHNHRLYDRFTLVRRSVDMKICSRVSVSFCCRLSEIFEIRYMISCVKTNGLCTG